MWSASMLVTTAMSGCSNRNEASLSSASATRYSPSPSLALAEMLFSLPPMMKVGSSPPSASRFAIRLVVVVLPWVPATAMLRFRRMSSASICALGTMGILHRCASTSSMFSSSIAVE